MSDRWMIYGATGYTGALLAEEAAARGHQPVLAGRSAEKVAALADRLGLPHAVFDLADEARIARQLKDSIWCFTRRGRSR